MTTHLRTLSLVIAGWGTIAATGASAHAFLDRAVPGVGSTVSAAPSELQLTFTESVVASLSGVTIASAGGGTIAASKPSVDASDRTTLNVRLGKALPPGTYIVKWHVVAVDTHPTSGSYKFTIAP